jgi:phosphatidylethanolamine-binding protein (PEBP) family uncharacterized protein
MSMLGRLLRNRRAGETRMAWQLSNLQGPDTLSLSSQKFEDGGTMPLENCAKFIGGADRSPDLAWSSLPPGTVQLLLVVEDLDVPQGRPAVHCAALIDPAADHLEPGALAGKEPGPGVRILRSTIGRGYHGPAPIKGHGPHRYVFQLFALGSALNGEAGGTSLDRARPRAVLAAVVPPVLGRGRLTGVYER